MRLTVKDDHGTTVLDVDGPAVWDLLTTQGPQMIVARDTGDGYTTPVVIVTSVDSLRTVLMWAQRGIDAVGDKGPRNSEWWRRWRIEAQKITGEMGIPR